MRGFMVQLTWKFTKPTTCCGVSQASFTDQGTNFESQLMKEICDPFGIRKIRTSSFHLRTDGHAEHMNLTIQERIAAVGGCLENALLFFTFSINATMNCMTGLSIGIHPSFSILFHFIFCCVSCLNV